MGPRGIIYLKDDVSGLRCAISIIAEQRIREACERGALIPSRSGQAAELEDDSHIPKTFRMAYKLLKNAGYVLKRS